MCNILFELTPPPRLRNRSGIEPIRCLTWDYREQKLVLSQNVGWRAHWECTGFTSEVSTNWRFLKVGKRNLHSLRISRLRTVLERGFLKAFGKPVILARHSSLGRGDWTGHDAPEARRRTISEASRTTTGHTVGGPS